MSRKTKQETAPRPTTRGWSTDLVGAAAAVGCSLVTWAIATQVVGVELTVEVREEVRRVSGPAVAIAAAGSAILGFLTLMILERITPYALSLWTALAIGFLAVSLLGPAAGTTSSARGTLIALHGVVAAVVLATAHRSRRRSSCSPTD